MKEILTEDLLAELLLSRDPQEFIEKYDITSRSLSEYLQALLEEKGLRRIDVIRSADLNETRSSWVSANRRATRSCRSLSPWAVR